MTEISITQVLKITVMHIYPLLKTNTFSVIHNNIVTNYIYCDAYRTVARSCNIHTSMPCRNYYALYASRICTMYAWLCLHFMIICNCIDTTHLLLYICNCIVFCILFSYYMLLVAKRFVIKIKNQLIIIIL